MSKRGLPPILFLALLGASSPSLAQQDTGGIRVVVERFRGPQSGSVRNGLVASLEEAGLTVVPEDEVRAKARELFGRTRLRDDDYPEVARALNLTAFFDGRVSRQRRRWALRVRVRNAADGMILGTGRWGGRTVGSLRAIRRNGHDRLAQYIQLASSPAAPPTPVAVQPQPVVEPGGTPWYADGETPPAEEDEDEDDEPRAPGAHDGFRARFLIGSVKRSMSAPVRVNTAFRPAGASADEVREFNSSGLGHMELGIAAELFPGALLDEPVAPWLGIAFSFRNSVLLETTGRACSPDTEPMGSPRLDPADPQGVPDCLGGIPVPVETTQREAYIGAKVDYQLGEDGPWLDVDVGYGRFSFLLEPNDLVLLERSLIVPPIVYSFLHLGLGVRLGLHETVQLGARVAYRQGFSVGDDARRIWGIETTSFRGWSIGADLIHRMTWASDHLYGTLSVEYFRFTTEFQGNTACRSVGESGDCVDTDLWEPWPEDGGFVDSVDDSYLRLSLGLGVVY